LKKTGDLRWEEDVGTDTTWARLLWKISSIGAHTGSSIWTSKVLLEAAEGALLGLLVVVSHSTDVGITDKHAETLAESSDLGATIIWLDVVHSHTTICTLEELVGHLWDTLIGSVTGTEVEDGGPVVGEILGECASCAGGE
jgi:hypothetical protein